MISNRCKYALKALIYITKKDRDINVLSSEISKEEQIPKKFLENILRDLKNAQILSSKRGAHGGYRLIKNPETVSMIEIIRLIDGPIALLPCISLTFYEDCTACNSEICSIKDVFIEVRNATLDIYRRTTLTKLAKTENKKTDFSI